MKIKSIIATWLVLMLFGQNLAFAQVLSGTTSVTLDLRVQPTSIVVTPKTVSAPEGGPDVQFTAMAKYEYPGLTTPIADRDITEDSSIVWSSSAVSVATVTTKGRATPVSDLNLGTATSTITATYAGLSDNGVLTVTGVVVTPPVTPPSSGGGGGGNGGALIYTVVVPGPTTPPKPTEPTVPDSPTTPTVPTTPDQPENPTVPTTPNNPSTPTTPTTPSNPVKPVTPVKPTIPKLPDSPKENYVPTPDLPKPDRPATTEELKEAAEKIGVKRGFVADKIGRDLKMFEIRKSTLDRCYADLENCTNIFRMRSKFEGIVLDPKNLKLFPDLDGNEYEDSINKMALLGIVNGYYDSVIDGKASPFMPEASILNVEFNKILTSSLAVAEGDTVYPTLFYRDIYVTYLLRALARQQSNAQAWLKIKTALAASRELTPDEENLIRGVKTIFTDIRPDQYASHWYYPIVYNRLCELKMIACVAGTSINPEGVPTEADVKKMVGNFVNYLNEKNVVAEATADQDSDQLENLDEKLIYATNPNLSDTDADQLKDGEEILKYKTDPNQVDTDKDGLSDGEEIVKYKTNPLLFDSDADSFSDKVEIDSGTDPNIANSLPTDVNNNGINDDWEAKYGLEVANGSQDSDSDGLSDILELSYSTDPTKLDSDGDGFTDAEEVLNMNTDPLNAESPGDVRNLPVVITNITYGQTIADSLPMIKGVGPASLAEEKVNIQIMLKNEFGSELLLGNTETDARGSFVFESDVALKNGRYYLVARAIRGTEIKISNPLLIIIDTNLKVDQAKPEKLEEVPITEEVLLKDLFLDVNTVDGRPTLKGKLSELGSRVNVTWKSLVLSSALIADTDGAFAVKAPRLESGTHSVFIQTVRKKDNAMSKTIKINFVLGVTGDDLTGTTDALKGSFDNRLTGISAITDLITKQGSWFWIVVVLAVAAVVGGAYYYFVMRDDEDEKPAQGKRNK